MLTTQTINNPQIIDNKGSEESAQNDFWKADLANTEETPQKNTQSLLGSLKNTGSKLITSITNDPKAFGMTSAKAGATVGTKVGAGVVTAASLPLLMIGDFCRHAVSEDSLYFLEQGVKIGGLAGFCLGVFIPVPAASFGVAAAGAIGGGAVGGVCTLFNAAGETILDTVELAPKIYEKCDNFLSSPFKEKAIKEKTA